MTRLEGKTSLGAFALLASTATASAEGVWVLWFTPITDNPPRWQSSVQHEFRTLEDCDRQAALIFNEFSQMYPNAVLEARCHPVSVDPRGAKRKPVVK
jgi:hypothetical protein